MPICRVAGAAQQPAPSLPWAASGSSNRPAPPQTPVSGRVSSTPDPAGQGVEAVRPIRDEIKVLVEGLIKEIAPEPQA
jgi:hypothetical protein